MRKLKNWITAALSTVMLLAMPLTSQAFTYHVGPTKYTDITDAQYDAIYNTLKSMAEDESHGRNEFRSTGVVCNTFEEAKAVMEAFYRLFPSSNSFHLAWNEWGASRITLTNYDQSTGIYSYSYNGNARGNDIWVVWNPNAEPMTVLSEGKQAVNEIKNIVESAPENTKEKLRYFYDIMKKRCVYDYEGLSNGYASQSPYDALINGRSVCGGFSKTFLLLCKQANIPCGIVHTDYSGEGEDHTYNIVYVDDHWLKVDTTHAICGGEDQFLQEVSADMQQYYQENFIYGIQQ